MPEGENETGGHQGGPVCSHPSLTPERYEEVTDPYAIDLGAPGRRYMVRKCTVCGEVVERNEIQDFQDTQLW
jgi:hypothetical protein